MGVYKPIADISAGIFFHTLFKQLDNNYFDFFFVNLHGNLTVNLPDI